MKKWNENHPSVMAWRELNLQERRQATRRRLAIKEDKKTMRRQWFGVCLLAFVVGAGFGDSGYWLMMAGVIGWTVLAITTPKGW